MAASLKGGEAMQKQIDGAARRATNAKEVAVGFFEDDVYEGGKYVAMVAALNEFGWAKAPPRPFFRRMIRLGETQWAPMLGRLLKASNFDAAQALGQIGRVMTDELKDSILANEYPPLAQSTIDAKGFDQTLVDTGRMLQSVRFKVR